MEGVLGIITGMISVILFFGTIIVVPYISISARTKERLALIESGGDPAILMKHSKPADVMKIGMFLLGGGVGTAAGYLLSLTGMHPAAAYVSMILVFAGAGLVLNRIVDKKKQN